MLHLGGTGDASWHSDLKAALEKNIDDLVIPQWPRPRVASDRGN